MVAVAEGEGMGGRSLPTGQGILGSNRCRTRRCLHKTAGSYHQEGCLGGEKEARFLT